ncbi:MAG: DUF4440 domain-containing protein [Acidobacteria bacterium]|nr:DUF4440 domain-containing protein [Acidobacteriota bacterium]NIQ30362.1 DUF4440 domain-containing protein [Acidobacteriota bacterium]
MTHRDLALAFLHRFAAGDVDGLEPLLAEDLRVKGPYLTVRSRAEYLAALRRDPPEPSGLRVLSVTENDDSVAVFYEYEKRDGALAVAQLFRFRGEQIRELRVVFDSGEFG